MHQYMCTLTMSQRVSLICMYLLFYSVQRLTHIQNVTCEATTEKAVTTNWKAMGPLVFGEAQKYLPGLYNIYI